MVDIEQLSKLARIKLGDDEKKKLQKEFGDILDYISKLKEADLNALEAGEEKTMTEKEILVNPVRDQSLNGINVTREDVDAHDRGKFSKELMEKAPLIEKGYFKVKHVFE